MSSRFNYHTLRLPDSVITHLNLILNSIPPELAKIDLHSLLTAGWILAINRHIASLNGYLENDSVHHYLDFIYEEIDNQVYELYSYLLPNYLYEEEEADAYSEYEKIVEVVYDLVANIEEAFREFLMTCYPAYPRDDSTFHAELELHGYDPRGYLILCG